MACIFVLFSYYNYFLFYFPDLRLFPYSSKELDQLEKEFVEQINQSNQIIRQPLANQYINNLGKKLTSTELNTPDFFLVNSNEINAFAGPGGHIGINSALILATQNESELAAVMAHEMAHVRLHHLYRLLEHEKQMRVPMLASVLAAAALGAINPTLASGALMASLTGFAQDNINFIRSNEKEADRIGINMLMKANINPNGMVSFFKKMQEHSRYFYTANIPPFLRTHPLDEDRIAEAESRITHDAQPGRTTSLQYALFKETIRTHVAENDKLLLDYYKLQCNKNNIPEACDFGLGLAFININQFQKAEHLLQPLIAKDKDNFYYEIAMSKVEMGLQRYNDALNRLKQLSQNYPDQYAILIGYAEVLLESKKSEEAKMLLLKANRQFKSNLSLCTLLANAYALNKEKSYAYFTQSQCLLIQGRKKEAITQLKTAKRLVGNDKFLLARIDAKSEEIKSSLLD